MTGVRKKTYSIIVSAIAACAVLVLFYVHEGDKKEKAREAHTIPEQAIEKFSVSETEGGKPRWVLQASSAQILEGQKKVLLHSPVVKFYEKGEYASTLVASHGRINTETYDIWGEGKCTLTTVKGERLETSNLRYHADTKKITTEDNVKLVRLRETVYGQGMEATPDLETIKIKKQRVEVIGGEKNNGQAP